MARAVIKVSKDLGPAMPGLSRSIDGCGYSPEANVLVFRYQDLRVLIAKKEIVVYGVEDAQTAKTVIEYLNRVLGTAGNSAESESTQ